MSQPEVNVSQPLDDRQALDLWKYLQDRADQIKERMWTITGWLFALMTGLLGVIADKCVDLGPSRIGEDQEQPWLVEPAMAACLSALGLFLCGYTLFMQRAYGHHVISNWVQANRILQGYPALRAVCLGEGPIKPVPDRLRDAVRLATLTFVLGFVFLTILVVAVIPRC